MWDEIKELIGNSAPILGTLLGGPAGGAVGGLIAKALGTSNDPEAISEAIKNNPDAFVKLKELENSKELAQLQAALNNKIEDNRHEEFYTVQDVGDKQNARAAASTLGPVQTDIAKKIYTQSAIGIPVLLGLNALLIIVTPIFNIDTTAVVAVGNLIGIALSNQYRERQSIIEFLFGSSVEKKKH